MSVAAIAAPINKAARIRILATERNLEALDIAKLTGYSMSEVRAALSHGELRKHPKSRASSA